MSLLPQEIKHNLRKSEFPLCAKEALARIERIYSSRPLLPKQMDFASELMAEFVFCEIDKRGSRKRKMSAIQELQLLHIFCDTFSSNDAAKNNLFMSLFTPLVPGRGRVLARLVSLAVSTKNPSVLAATGVWMQQLGCTSDPSLELTRALLHDFFVLVPMARLGLLDLPIRASHFTANWLAAIAHIYAKSPCDGPPQAVLEVVTQWVSDHPSLCLAALMINMLQALPPGSIPMNPVTPYAGLFSWCILAPIRLNITPTEVLLFSSLHVALLQSVLECLAGQNVAAVSSQHLGLMTGPLAKLKHDSLALERLAQAVHACLAAGCVYGNRQELFNHLEALPENRLLKVVLTTHRNKS